jgi:hypothetical protein
MPNYGLLTVGMYFRNTFFLNNADYDPTVPPVFWKAVQIFVGERNVHFISKRGVTKQRQVNCPNVCLNVHIPLCFISTALSQLFTLVFGSKVARKLFQITQKHFRTFFWGQIWNFNGVKMGRIFEQTSCEDEANFVRNQFHVTNFGVPM